MNTANEITTVNVKILGRDLKIKCATAELPELETAIRYVEEKASRGKEKDTVISSDTMAIFTALNIAQELIAHQKHSTKDSDFENLLGRIENLHAKIHTALEKSNY